VPAVSRAERSAMAIAEHHPEQLYARNRGLLKLSHQQLHDFASTPAKGLPARKNPLERAKDHMRRRVG
jgi:hypothetical protein